MDSYTIQDDQNEAPPAPRVGNDSRRANKSIHLILSALFPCFPEAQVASSMGESYWFVLTCFGAVFVGSGIAYAASLSMIDMTWQFQPIYIPMAWAIYMCGLVGLVAASLLIVFVLEIGKSVNDTGRPFEFRYASVLWASVMVVCQLLLIYKTVHLRSKLAEQRFRPSLGSEVCFTVCCPCCSLTEMAVHVACRTKTPAGSFASVDELPAYSATV